MCVESRTSDDVANDDTSSSTSTSHNASNEHKTTALQTYLHLLKGYVGPGCLSLPWAFSRLGLTLGLCTTVALCVLTSYNSLAMVKVKRDKFVGGTDGEEGGKREVTYSDIGELAYGRKFRKYVTASIVVQQMAVCTVFFSFIGDNISSAMALILSPKSPLANDRMVITLTMPAAMALSCIPDLRALSPATAVATALLFVAFGILGVVIGENWEGRPRGLPGVTWAQVPIAMCAIMYSYEGIALILPVQSAMIEPKKFHRTFKLAMASVCFIFGAFATICVIALGEVDDGSITAFLVDRRDEYSGGPLVLVANTIVSMSVLFTYPLQLFPCIQLISQLRRRRSHEAGVEMRNSRSGSSATDGVGGGTNVDFMPLEGEEEEERFKEDTAGEGLGDEEHQLAGENSPGRGGIAILPPPSTSSSLEEGDSPGLRAVLVVVTYLVAVFIPNVQELISLAGALAGASVALIIPPLIEMRFALESSHRLGMGPVRCYVLLAIGVSFGLIGTVASIQNIVQGS